ncbi:hypothetical protein BOX15_Mlig018986g2 [Macrostomum lignano]|uniref:Phospholipid scramblase n=1 Tax=Macrostomum lignano TaxID=282301 RepID=A0A267GFV4_9PLAT|nr:hypothetical protein BOX15_Mlig018986g2 [Macrostomum lignano]
MDCLADLRRIKIRRNIDLLDVVCGCETNSKFEICNEIGLPLLLAKEETGFWNRVLCEADRAFLIKVTSLQQSYADNPDSEVIRYTRGCVCNCQLQLGGCCFTCRDSLTVEAPPGTVIGFVRQQASMCTVSYTALTGDEHEASSSTVHLVGPRYCQCTCPRYVQSVSLMSCDMTREIGRLRRTGQIGDTAKELLRSEWGSFIELDLQPDAGLSVHTKAVLVGAALLIGILFFDDERL